MPYSPLSSPAIMITELPLGFHISCPDLFTFDLPLNPSWSHGRSTEPMFSSTTDHSIILKPHNAPFDQHPFLPSNLQSHGITIGQTTTRVEQNDNGNGQCRSKKKPSDRHSKIAVRNRLRHRRTRLSIDVARQLFELQDMLRFERASKAVEWLLVLAEPEIMKLKRELNPESNSANNSESAVSGLDEATEAAGDQLGSVKACDGKRRKDWRSPRPRRGGYNVLAKEARKMARKRARERTLKKQAQSNYI